MTITTKRALQKLAYNAIEAKLYKKKMTDFSIDLSKDAPVLNEPHCVFVTLRIDGELRGCMGCFQPPENTNIYQMIQKYAVVAAFEDNRFSPLTIPELSKIKIEISILSPLEKISGNAVEIASDGSVKPSFKSLKYYEPIIRVGTDGLIVVSAGHSGVFLPEVPTEFDWDLEEYLDKLCGKGGLDKECWKWSTTDLYRFTSYHF